MNPAQNRRITRHRELRACIECRRRKLRCDRHLPCASCTRRDEASSCAYARSEGHSNDRQNLSEAEVRLEHLEKLIRELSKSQTPSIHSSTTQSHSGRVEFSPESLHNGATHWSAMLDDIDELRSVMRDHDDFEDAGTDYKSYDAYGVLFGTKKALPYHYVLSQFLPTRQKADRLVGAYFRSKTVAAPFIHTGQFRRLYQTFWDNPATASPLWASILFSMLGISTDVLSKTTGAEEHGTLGRYATAAAHCLVAGEYRRPQRFSVEALLLYAHAKCLSGADFGPDIAILFGTLVRLATVMCYHRDADNFKGKVSAFEGEIRRRAWSLCMQLDTLVSFQLGLPSNVQFPTWDTKPPTNLLDSDFDEDTLELPPARPVTEPTELQFYVAKHKLVTVFEKIIRHTLSATERSQEELQEIDQELRNTFANLPGCYQPRPMADSIVDSPSVMIARLCVCSIYHKSLCVLHRKYITRGNTNSLRVCYTAASDLIKQFLEVYNEFGVGGHLEAERWFMGNITLHDFLLGCTTLCLCVCYTKHSAASPGSTMAFDVEASLNMLQDAKLICLEQSITRKDAKKVQRLIEATVERFAPHSTGSTSGSQYQTDTTEDLIDEANWPGIPPVFDEDWSCIDIMAGSTDEGGWVFPQQFFVPQDYEAIDQI
ncbi:hypothetical protein CJF31_00003319 [Rutstroemia sp. NJR-2017a BVV2]|nr:hypothetical protein CJF31_00002111 [Rutstroemia sp. NJR-2017a BVV2]PQE18612.1 hypothetical protein CJF31_00003319 [Rutstroemia sp. NJR-2017a BVV2]